MKTLFLHTFIILSCLGVTAADEGKHLFLLSGQSNMSRFQHKQFFIPAVQAAYGADKVIVIKNAQGGQPISKWYKAWTSGKGEKPEKTGQLYAALIDNIKEQTAGIKIKSVTFIWMQGEADSKAKNSDAYLASLNGLKKQLEQDLKRTDLNFIIGRLSDSGLYRRRDKKRVENPHWEEIRKAQQAFADASQRAVWIDTDDLNGEKNALHLIKPEGYETLGNRYVKAAVELVKAK